MITTLIAYTVVLLIGCAIGMVLGYAVRNAEKAQDRDIGDAIRSGKLDGDIERAIQRNNQRKGQS